MSSLSCPQLPTSIDAAIGQAQVSGPRLTTYRWVTIGILMSLLWKARYYPAAYQMYQDLQLSDPFFPAWLRSATTLIALLGISMLLGSAVLVLRSRLLIRTQAVATLACMAGLCWHQGSYNDVTFLTCFWTAAWCTWYAFSTDQPWASLLPKARQFAVLVVSMIFLGGAVGKWTPGYWSGEVLFQIYFIDRDFWFFNLLRDRLDAETLRSFATFYSRMVVVLESACALLWLLPARWGAAIALTTFLGIILFSNFHLFSVMFCLLGLCLVSLQPDPLDKPAENR